VFGGDPIQRRAGGEAMKWRIDVRPRMIRHAGGAAGGIHPDDAAHLPGIRRIARENDPALDARCLWHVSVVSGREVDAVERDGGRRHRSMDPA